MKQAKNIRPVIITISGVDGSGKSTQVKSLIESLSERGSKVFYFHAVQFSVANRGKDKIVEPGSQKGVTEASWYKVQLRKVALLIDILRFDFLVRSLQKKGYTHIVSDRYFYDSLVNILFLSGDSGYHSFGVEFLRKLVEIPSHAIYLSVSAKEIASRERDVDQGDDYLKGKISLFNDVAENWGLQKVNGKGDPNAISHKVFAIISEKIKLRSLDVETKSFGYDKRDENTSHE